MRPICWSRSVAYRGPSPLVARGVLAGQPQAHRLIGYLTKSLGESHVPDTDAARAHHARLVEALRWEPVFAALRELAAVRRPGQECPTRPAPGCLPRGGAPTAQPRLRRPPGPGLPLMVRQDPHRPPRRPPRLRPRGPGRTARRPAPRRHRAT